MKYSALWCTILLTMPVASRAQAPAPSPEHQAKMAALHVLVGEWHGSGSARMGPGEPQKATVVERVESRLDGMVLVVEGIGTADIPDRGEVVVHHAFGVLSYDSQQERYLMRAFKKDGNYVDADITVEDGVVVWGMSVGQYGTVRYTIRLNDKGQWTEIGEINRDGATWTPFFEMTLDKTGG